MRKGFIKVHEGPDVLRWGYTNRGSFNTKEAYNIRLTHHVEANGIQKKIWAVNL